MADTEGFEEFYLVTVGRLLGVLFPVTGDLHEAEEIVQEAYARASVRWARLRDHDAPEAWVRRVASCSTTWSTCPSTRWRRSSAPAPAR